MRFSFDCTFAMPRAIVMCVGGGVDGDSRYVTDVQKGVVTGLWLQGWVEGEVGVGKRRWVYTVAMTWIAACLHANAVCGWVALACLMLQLGDSRQVVTLVVRMHSDSDHFAIMYRN